MIRITLLRYGTNRLPDVTVAPGTTIADIREQFGPALGLPESCTALVNNEAVSDTYVVENGDSITFEKQACKKA